MKRLANLLHTHSNRLAYIIMALGMIAGFVLIEVRRVEGRKAICNFATTYTSALVSASTDEPDASRAEERSQDRRLKLFIDILNRDLEPLGCQITLDEVQMTPLPTRLVR